MYNEKFLSFYFEQDVSSYARRVELGATSILVIMAITKKEFRTKVKIIVRYTSLFGVKSYERTNPGLESNGEITILRPHTKVQRTRDA